MVTELAEYQMFVWVGGQLVACIMQTRRWIVKRTINQSGFDAIRWTHTIQHRESSIFHLDTITTTNFSPFLLLFMQYLDCDLFSSPVSLGGGELGICVMFYIPLFDHLIEINWQVSIDIATRKKEKWNLFQLIAELDPGGERGGNGTKIKKSK